MDEITERRNELNSLKADVDQKLMEEKQGSIEVKAPLAVKEHDRLNIVVLGPEGCGKTTMANYLAQEHQRTVVKVNQLYDWTLKRGNELTDKANAYLAEKETEMEADREAFKKIKPKKGEAPPVFDESKYKKLSPELVTEIIKERLSMDDCLAGAIFDCIKSEQLGDEKEIIERITEAVPGQNLQLLLLKFNKEQAQEEEDGAMQVCTNYRLARRRTTVTEKPGKSRESENPASAQE